MSFNAAAILERSAAKYAASIAYARNANMIPYIGEKGVWQPAPFEGNAWWTGGFWPALMWQFYHLSKDEGFMHEAHRAQALLHHELLHNHEGMHHDVGFMYKLPYQAQNALFPNEEATRIIMRAADLLAGRFNPLGFIKAWNGKGREGWSIVDCMMNLPLLYWASAQSGDPRYQKIADLHVEFTMKHFVRPDGSSNHIVVADPETGEILETPAGQGYASGSSWSRGQAWALYGFALAYQNAGKQAYLDTAKRIAHYFIANIRQDGLVACDFRQPESPLILDNIAGACAASGLLLLLDLVPEHEKHIYHEAALRLLSAMDALCADYTDNQFGILQKCTAAYHNREAGTHVNIVYGDYFYIEALLRLENKVLPLWGIA